MGLCKTLPRSSIASFVQEKQANHGPLAVMYYVFTDTFAYLIGAISRLRFRRLRECPKALALLPNPQIWGMSSRSWESMKGPKKDQSLLLFFVFASFSLSLVYKTENICVTKCWNNVCASLAQPHQRTGARSLPTDNILSNHIRGKQTGHRVQTASLLTAGTN